MTVEVRRAGSDDWALWRDLRLAALRGAPEAFGSSYEREASRTEAEWREFLTRADGTRYVATDGAAGIGIAGGYLRPERGPIPELVAMWVDPDRRSAGVGRALVENVARWAGDQGFSELRLYVAETNPEALRFYERLGFAPNGFRQEMPHRADVFEIEMTRAVWGACRAHVAWDPALVAYDFGPHHPMAPVRVDLTMRLARAFGVLDRDSVLVAAPAPASDELLELVHTAEYVAAVRRVSADPSLVDLGRGLGTDDNPVFAGMHDATALVVGGSLAAAEAVWSGRAQHGVNVAGGLHHAMAGACSGFCVYNDPAIAIRWLLAHGAERVAYVDVDVHHGDGVQAAFWNDPRVLTISIHETPRYLFPGTGYPDETGGVGARGSAVNIALPPGTGDRGWLRAFHAVAPPLLEAFTPDVLFSQHGCDTHADDPLAHLALSIDAQRASYLAIHELAHAHCGGRWVATGGGGYAVTDVVPRIWTHLLAIASGAPLDPAAEVPADWREDVRERLGVRTPARMTDGGEASYTPLAAGYDPADALDRAILATRSAVFPEHGLDPMP